MRRAVLLLSLVTLVAACAPRRVPDGFQALGSSPVAVRLLPPQDGFLRFLTSEPAYVAVFEVAPDRGVSLLYPQYREESARVSRAGVNVEFLPWRVQGRWFYASTPYYSSFTAWSRPTYLYVIASKSPLRTEDIRRSPVALRSAMGWRSFLASDLSGTLDDLERIVVGDIADEEWSSDLYVIWPEMPLSQPWQTRYVFLNCPEGGTVVVPFGWNIQACPGSRNLAQATKPATPPAAPASPPGSVPETDSTGIPVKPEPTDGKPNQPVAPRVLDAAPVQSAINSRPRIDDATQPRPVTGRSGDAERPPRMEEPPRAAPEPRPMPAPQPEPQRIEPQPRVEPQRSEPRPAPAEPRAPAEPKRPANR